MLPSLCQVQCCRSLKPAHSLMEKFPAVHFGFAGHLQDTCRALAGHLQGTCRALAGHLQDTCSSMPQPVVSVCQNACVSCSAGPMGVMIGSDVVACKCVLACSQQ
jgi:hypothetical protein